MFGIIANMSIDKNTYLIKRITKYLDKLGIEYYIAKTSKDSFGNFIYKGLTNKDIKYIISLGGDGTMVQACQNAINLGVPILGFNTGHLGFLTEFEENDIENVLLKIIKHEYHIESRMMLDVYKNGKLLDTALNDISITRIGFSRIVSIKATMDYGVSIGTYNGDGLVVSTPTGSTAYNLSLGGPILSPQCRNIILTPVACHSLSLRPIVLDSKRELELQILKSNKTQKKEAILTCDGRKNIELKSNDFLKIKKSTKSADFIKLDLDNFFDIYNKKLK